jgi:Fic family protein
MIKWLALLCKDNHTIMQYKIPQLPLDLDLETKAILKKTAAARSALAELKGAALSIPNQSILINTLALQEAKDSSAIENIVTTHDELYQSDYLTNSFKSAASKEVHKYSTALRTGYQRVQQSKLIQNSLILEIQEIIDGNRAGYRKLPGTELRNDRTGETVYIPPQSYDEIVQYMQNLEVFVNDDMVSDLDPLVKMAIIHHQFESIHPFYDGNGRTGRILNILYLVKQDLLNIPILYVSRYINQHKNDYYRLLQKVRNEGAWHEWILFMLEAIEQTSLQTLRVVQQIKDLMLKHKRTMRENLPKIYSQDLLNNIFKHPYTKIEFVINELNVSRPTATRYLDSLAEIGLLDKQKPGRESYYVNKELVTILSSVSEA